MLLPLVWTVFALATVAGFVMIATYWLDVQDRPDLTMRARLAWSAGILLFPIAIPLYALAGGPDWPVVLRVAAFVPALALLLLFGFASGAFT